jgi:4-hydroxy-2-oxoheptanedioate aldolase
LKELFAQDRPALGGWLTVPSGFSAELFAHAGFDWVCVDMQHGVIGYQAAVSMIQAISTGGATPIVRVPWNEPGTIMKVLDAGAYGVIVPMVNSRAEAEAAAGACRYPPRGYRSYGPIRAPLYAGPDYFQGADEHVLCIVMIETEEALANLDEIVSTPGVDVAYIGPADLSVQLGYAPAPYHEDERYASAVQAVLDACRRHGVVPGFHGGNPANARARIMQGFRFVEVTSDAEALVRAAHADLRALREGGGRPPTYA